MGDEIAVRCRIFVQRVGAVCKVLHSRAALAGGPFQLFAGIGLDLCTLARGHGLGREDNRIACTVLAGQGQGRALDLCAELVSL